MALSVTPSGPERSLRIKYIIGIVALIILLCTVLNRKLYSVLVTVGLPNTKEAMFTVSRFLFWIFPALLWLYAKKIEKQDLFLWKDHRYNALQWLKYAAGLIAFIFVSLIVVNMMLYIAGVKEKSAAFQALVKIFRGNTFLLILTMITAGVTEEIIHRGYLQPRLEILFKSPAAGIFISSLLFGLSHFGYGTISNMVGPFVIGLIFACFYYKYRNIKILMLVHFLWDMIGILIIMSRHTH